MENDLNLYFIGKDTDTQYDRVINYINKRYSVRYNEISIQFQIKPKGGEKWSVLNLNSLHIELEQAEIKMNIPKLEILFKSHLVKTYNPIVGYFKSLPKWDGVDHIKNLCSHVKTDNDKLFNYHFEKWFTRSVLCSLTEDYVNKQCFVLVSKEQNIGKTTFLRFLAPKELKEFYTEDIGTDKDSLIKLSKNMFINIDELAVKNKSDINGLKANLSKAYINERLPYGKHQELLKRISNFLASTNETNFLTDETGSVRWLNFETFAIDFGYDKIDIDQVWSQAYYNAFEREDYNPDLTVEDVKENEKRNQRFQHWSMEKELIEKYLEPSDEIIDFMSATDVIIQLRAMGVGMKLDKTKIGKALKSLSYPEARQKDGNRPRGYLIKQKAF